MKRVDQMIKYLSGDLSQEESRAFEKELLQDKELKGSFDQVSKAYHLISRQLRHQDEAKFISTLKEVMDRSSPKVSGGPGKRSGLMLLLSLAASIAIVLTILLINRNDKDIYLAYYHPLDDQVVLSVNQETRGEYGSVASLFTSEEYKSVIEETTHLLLLDKGNQTALLFNLLASIELDQEEEALVRFEQVEPDPSHILGQSLAWYRILALVKADRMEEAMRVLEALMAQPGPYKSDAHKLQKKLIK
jgi:hypothetical protein